jgi:hypothetical protein
MLLPLGQFLWLCMISVLRKEFRLRDRLAAAAEAKDEGGDASFRLLRLLELVLSLSLVFCCCGSSWRSWTFRCSFAIAGTTTGRYVDVGHTLQSCCNYQP